MSDFMIGYFYGASATTFLAAVYLLVAHIDAGNTLLGFSIGLLISIAFVRWFEVRS